MCMSNPDFNSGIPTSVPMSDNKTVRILDRSPVPQLNMQKVKDAVKEEEGFGPMKLDFAQNDN